MHNVAIIGGGPAGLTAGIYLARGRVPCMIIEKMFPGGTILLTETIENYPGFSEGVGGQALAAQMEGQFLRFGGRIEPGEVTGVGQTDRGFLVKTADGPQFPAAAVIVATGGSRRKLGVPGEETLAGRGVSYCAVCDGALFRDKVVAVSGGGDTALEDAVLLTRFATRVFLIHRREEFRGGAHLQETMRANPKIACLLSRIVTAISGEKRVEALELRHVGTGETSRLPVDGIFVSIGQVPNTGFLGGLAETTDTGHLVTDERMATSCPGLFAVGDCRRKTFYQVVTACGDGAVAARSVEQHLETLPAGSP
jgi:thioredoxin reductase (NADPH)